MKGLDTNVLVRYLVRDDEQQWRRACDYILEALGQGEVCFINNIVLCELTWVLSRAYKLSRDRVVDVLDKLLRTSSFEFENRSAVTLALQRMKNGKADFADYLVGKINQQCGCMETASFDRQVQGVEGFVIL